MQTSSLMAIALSVLCVTAPVAAQELPRAEPGAQSQALRSGAAELPATDADADAAARWYERAEAEWRNGEPGAARESMRRSYELSGRPELLFNLGQLSRELGECEPASRYYREYLQRAPGAGREADARRALSQLESQCGAPFVPKPTPVTPVLPPPRPEQPYWSTPRVVGWSAVSLGAAAAAGAVYFAFSAASAEADLERLRDGGARDAARADAVAWDAQASDREGEGKRAATLGRVFAVSAVALVGGGAFLVIANPGAQRSEPAPLAVGFTTTGLRAEYSLEF